MDRSKMPVVEFPLAEFEKLLVADEGRKLVPYKDTRGFWTVGVGHLIGTTLLNWKGGQAPISSAFADLLFKSDVETACAALDRLVPWWRTLSPVRQMVLASMMFQMGPRTLATFGETLDLIEGGHYVQAGRHMAASRWAKQTPNRVARLVVMLVDDKL